MPVRAHRAILAIREARPTLNARKAPTAKSAASKGEDVNRANLEREVETMVNIVPFWDSGRERTIRQGRPSAAHPSYGVSVTAKRACLRTLPGPLWLDA